MFLRITMLAVFLFFLAQVEGQVKRKIKRGRRNKSESQLVLDPGDFQVEWEAGHEGINDSLSTFVHPNLVLRYGVSKATDISLEVNSLTTKQKGALGNKSTTGIEPILLGVDHIFLKETAQRPSLAGRFQLAFPFAASSSYQATHLGPILQISAGRTVRSDDVATCSAGLFWDGFSTVPIYTYGADYLLQLGKHYAASASLFGFLGSGLPQHNIDLSAFWQPRDSFQLGVTAGIGLNASAHKNYISVSGVIGFWNHHDVAETAH